MSATQQLQDDGSVYPPGYRIPTPSPMSRQITDIIDVPGSPLLCSEETISDSDEELGIPSEDSDFEVWVQTLPEPRQREIELRRSTVVKTPAGSYRVFPDVRGPKVYFVCPHHTLGCEAGTLLGTSTYHYCKFAPRQCVSTRR